jgi:F-type H+-transporting ATPase subunit delta
MLSGAVTNRYTLGFYNYAKEQGIVEKVDESLKLLTSVLALHPELKSLLEHPLISVDAKATVLKNVLGDQLGPVVGRFLHMLFERGRSAYITSIAGRFHELTEAEKGTLTVQIESAGPLSETDTKQIESKLSLVFDKKVGAIVRVNPELIAGYRVRVGNRVLDATIRGALAQFSEKLLAGKAIKEGTH